MELNNPHNPEHEEASVSMKVILMIFAIVVVGTLGYLVYVQNTTPTEDTDSVNIYKKVTPTAVTDSTATATATVAATTTNETANWKTFTASAQGDNLTFKYPPDYTVNENSDGFIALKSSSGKLVADLTAATGSRTTNVEFIAKVTNQWFQAEPTKTEVTTALGSSCTKLSGTFGKKVGSFNSVADGGHNGNTGSVYVCQKSSQLPTVFDSYDNGDTTLTKTFGLILDSLSR